MQNKERDNGSKGYPIGVAREHQDDEKGGSAPNIKSTPSEAPEPNQIGSGTAGTGKINYRSDGRDEHGDSAPHLVQRKTGLQD